MKLVKLLALFLLAIGTIHAQSSSNDPVFLDYADSLKSSVVDSQTVRTFLGHVKVHQGNVTMTCDRAVHNLSTNVVDLTGSVRVVEDTMVITAPHIKYETATRLANADGGVRLTDHVVTLTAITGTYNVDTRVAVFHDHVKIVNDTATITANHLTYNRNTERSVATSNVQIVDSSTIILCAMLINDRVPNLSWCSGNVRVRNKTDRSMLFGDSLFHDAVRAYSNIPRNPLLLHVDSTREDSLANWKYDTTFVSARSMEALRLHQETYLAHDSVRVVRNDLQARCGEGAFFRSNDVIGLGKNPIVWYNSTQLTGDSLTIYLDHNKLSRIVDERSAFSLTCRDSLHPKRFDQLAGSRLTMQFRADSLRSIRVEKNAQSIYFGYEEHRARGANRISGDTIVIDIALNKPDKVYTLGGGEGLYSPEKIVRKNELDFRLSGFDNREAERPRRSDIQVP